MEAEMKEMQLAKSREGDKSAFLKRKNGLS
jgi:hypothetical protein